MRKMIGFSTLTAIALSAMLSACSNNIGKATVVIKDQNETYVDYVVSFSLNDESTAYDITKNLLEQKDISYEENNSYFLSFNDIANTEEKTWVLFYNGNYSIENAKELSPANNSNIVWEYVDVADFKR